MWKMDPMSGFNIRLVFTLPPSDSTLQYKRCVHLWVSIVKTEQFLAHDQTEMQR